MATATIHNLDNIEDYNQSNSFDNYDTYDMVFETDPVAFGVAVDFGPGRLQVCCEFGQCYDLNKFCLGSPTKDEIIPFDDPARRSFPNMNKLDAYRQRIFFSYALELCS